MKMVMVSIVKAVQVVVVTGFRCKRVQGKVSRYEHCTTPVRVKWIHS